MNTNSQVNQSGLQGIYINIWRKSSPPKPVRSCGRKENSFFVLSDFDFESKLSWLNSTRLNQDPAVRRRKGRIPQSFDDGAQKTPWPS